MNAKVLPECVMKIPILDNETEIKVDKKGIGWVIDTIKGTEIPIEGLAMYRYDNNGKPLVRIGDARETWYHPIFSTAPDIAPPTPRTPRVSTIQSTARKIPAEADPEPQSLYTPSTRTATPQVKKEVKERKGGRKTLLVLLVISLLAAMSFFSYWFFMKRRNINAPFVSPLPISPKPQFINDAKIDPTTPWISN
jgi:hypothetical protein